MQQQDASCASASSRSTGTAAAHCRRRGHVGGAAVIGTVGSVAGPAALALLRLDRAAEAAAKGQPLTADGVAIVTRKPIRPRSHAIAPTPPPRATP